MRVAFATDEDTVVSETVVDHLARSGHEVLHLAQGEQWPEVGRSVAEAVAGGTVDRGVVCCHTGTGVSIAANKVKGVRAALCTDAPTAAGARRWNDANVLALGLRLTSPDVAREIVDAFLTTAPDAGEEVVVSRVEPSR